MNSLNRAEVVALADRLTPGVLQLLEGEASPLGRTGERGSVPALLEELRSGLRADGADVELVSLDGREVVFRLRFSDAACEACVLPADRLQPVFELAVERHLGRGLRVVLLDPRRERGPGR